MEINEKAKRKNDDEKAKGRPRQGLSNRAVLMLILFAALVMGIFIVVVVETASSPAPYPAERLIYNTITTRSTLDLRTGVTTTVGQADEGHDVLSPDGQWLARWIVDGELGDSWLVLTHAKTGETHIPFERHFYRTSLRISWSPDSQWIAFHSTPSLASSNDTFELWRVNIQTGVLEQLTRNNTLDVDPDFSPDGTQLVFSSEVDGQGYLSLLMLDTGQTQRLNLGMAGYGPRWSPDGLWLVFAVTPYTMSTLWIVRIDGSGAQMVVQDAMWSNYGWER